jgi:hypothetical protein
MTKLEFLYHEPPARTMIRVAARVTRRSLGGFCWHFMLAAKFDALAYNPYGNGLIVACELAKRFSIPAISAIEFGVARGDGLRSLCQYASILSGLYGIEIRVFGFDSGVGLPSALGYQDAPWAWNPGDFPAGDVASRLPENGRIIVGEIAETFPLWMSENHPPLAFASIDVDYYSSAKAILEALRQGSVAPIVQLYFDDVHRFLIPDCVGEMQAIREFNEAGAASRRIEPASWMADDRPFPEAAWLSRMFELYCFDHPTLQRHQRREALEIHQ